MSITLHEPNRSIALMMKSHIEAMVIQAQFEPVTVINASSKTLSLIAPHKVYSLGLDAIGEANFLPHAYMTGWRYLIESGSEIVASAETHANDAEETGVFGSTTEGIFEASTREAMLIAEQSSELLSGAYALQLLRVPALCVQALWLKRSGNDRQQDFYLPLRPAPEPLLAQVMMNASLFAGALVKVKTLRGESVM